MSGTLDEAWARAEATLPEQALIRLGRTGMTRTGWATAYLHGHHIGTAFSDDGPAAALNALTDRFEYRCGCTIHTDRGEVCPRPGPFCQECQDVCWGLVKPDSAYTAETARLLLTKMAPALPPADPTLMSKSGSMDDPIFALVLTALGAVLLLLIYRVLGAMAG